ncbi:3'(2'),5'-bisphosphate nucleotidase CysQ [Variibacter gotjawalensis]|nr:3'(2'),5'-bisphosphate nucleotidase CysQ [Variibacter gotjawalensis]NIK49501.1 3'(2'), 5'-bisphosphate nucleotidase [Variibacter gotjawalensis]
MSLNLNDAEAARLLEAMTTIAAQASAAILAIAAPKTRTKADASPVTEADEAAEAVIVQGLRAISPSIAIVSEESATAETPAPTGPFFMVDPLDGTREFIAGRNEYTVNISLIVDGEPTLGVVTAPALGLAWRGRPGRAERLSLDGSNAAEIRVRSWPAAGAMALVSRSHLDPASVALLERLPGIAQTECGSAVKFCRVAEGAADLYPRLAPTREWDVAAGHAVLKAAGGCVVRPDGSRIPYGDAAGGFLIPSFVAVGDLAAAANLCAA